MTRPAILPLPLGQLELTERLLNGSQAKTAYALRLNAERMIKDCPGGIESVGFMTLTVGEYEQGPMLPDHERRFIQVKNSAEASRRINNLHRRVLDDLFDRCIVVTERHKSGAIHFHILGTLKGYPDIRTGLDWKQLKARDYSSAPDRLRGLWAWLRNTLPAYGFGRAELLPVRKTGEAVASYVSKYIEKNVCNRLKEDRNKKLVRYVGFSGQQLKPNEFEWNTERAIAWRAKARALADLVYCQIPDRNCQFPAHVVWACAHSKGYIRPRQLDGTWAYEAFGRHWAFTLTQLWRAAFDDDVNPGFSWNFKERHTVRLELIRISGDWYRQRETERLCDAPLLKIAGETFTRAEWDGYKKAGDPESVCILTQLRRN